MIWIFDSSPLIYLNKVGLNWIFELLEGEKVIPVTVYNQVVVQGKMRGEADAVISENLIKKGIINVEKVENGFKKKLESFGSELHEGELEVLALAKNKDGTAILDESIARDIGRILSIEIHGTLFLIFLMMRRNLLKKEEAKDRVNVMVRKGFRLSHDKYIEFMELLESI